MICEFCKKEFSSVSSLNYHIKNAKYCIKLRGGQPTKQTLSCLYCKNDFASEQSLQRHLLKYTVYKYVQNNSSENKILSQDNKTKVEIISKLESQVKDLQDQLASIAKAAASKPTNVNNTQTINQVINNLTPLTDEYLKETAQYLTLDNIKKGVEGYVKFALEYPFKNRITCVDVSRRKVKYKNKDGTVMTDPEMTSLTKKLFTAINDVNVKLITDCVTELNNKMLNAHKDMGDEMTEEESNQATASACELVDQMSELVGQRCKVKDISMGGRNEFFYEFIKNVCMNSA